MKKWKTVISADSGLFDLRLREVWDYRDLCYTFIRKNYITRYKQTILGPLYMVLAPLLTSGIFSVVFGSIAKIATDGIPNFLFYMSGNLVWGFFSGCLKDNSNIFGGNASVMGKVYFPRLSIPLANALTKMLDMTIQLLLFLLLFFLFQMRGYEFHPNLWIVTVPFLLIMISALGFGMGLICSSLTIKYKDLNVMLNFGLNLLMYISPVIYPISSVEGSWQKLILLNPLAGVISTFRYAFFGTGTIAVWSLIWAFFVTVTVLLYGMVLFNKVEKTFIDTV